MIVIMAIKNPQNQSAMWVYSFGKARADADTLKHGVRGGKNCPNSSKSLQSAVSIDDKGTLENALDKVFVKSDLIDNAIPRNDSTAIVA